MVKGNISQEFRLTNTDETRNHFVEEIEQNELMSNNYIKVCMKLIEHLLILVFAITGYIPIDALFLCLIFL